MYDMQLRIPLGPLPAGYEPYVLTSSQSDKPISHYIPLPLPTISSALPSHLFMDTKNCPKTNDDWITRNAPLTYWHVTHFNHPGKEYSCIGITISHGLLDGMGLASVIHALEAETLGKEWDVPPSPHSGLNVNPLQVILDKAIKAEDEKATTTTVKRYHGVSVVGIGFILMITIWHLLQWLWHGSERKMAILPPKVYEKVVNDARAAMDKESGGQSKVRLSTGDVLSAWIFKVCNASVMHVLLNNPISFRQLAYSDNTSKSKKVQLSNQASLRAFFPQDLKNYSHNCFVPIPIPLFTVKDIQTTPVHRLAHIFATARSSLSISEAVSIYRDVYQGFKPSRTKMILPYDERSDENMIMSNMSIARMVDINWTGLGGGKTVCRYKALIGTPVLASNVVTITGRLADGSTLLDLVLNREKTRKIEAEIQRILKEVE